MNAGTYFIAENGLVMMPVPFGYQFPTSSKVRRYHSKSEVSKRRRKAILERDNYTCKHCGGTEDICVDHIIAVAKGGTHGDDNLQALCRTCNSIKGVK